MITPDRKVDEEYIPLSKSIIEDQGTPTRQGAITLLTTRQEAFRKLLSVQTAQSVVIKLPIHRNTEQRELIVHIGSLQKVLEKPKHRVVLSLMVEESFTYWTSERNHLCQKT